jgi:hypothetical protein
MEQNMQIISDALSSEASTSELKKYIDPFSGQTAISILSRVLGLPIAMIDLGPKDFSALFPKNQIPSVAIGFFGHDLKRYRSWRLMMLDVTSREVVRVFLKQLWFQFVPVFHGLQGRSTMKN